MSARDRAQKVRDGLCRDCCWPRTSVSRNCVRCLEAHRLRSAAKSPTYRTWANMLTRCRNPKSTHYDRYGGRGIKVCDAWLTFVGFVADMGEKPEGVTLERIDNDGHYEPGNVRWATKREQANNRRTSRFLEFRGERRTVADWCRAVGLDEKVVRRRLQLGWDVEQVLTTTVKGAA